MIVGRIPKSFQLFGHTIEVSLEDEYIVHREQLCRGLWCPEQNKIRLANAKDQADSILHQTLWHEMVHAVLDRLGEDELSNNEKLVDLLGQAFYQINITAKY